MAMAHVRLPLLLWLCSNNALKSTAPRAILYCVPTACSFPCPWLWVGAGVCQFDTYCVHREDMQRWVSALQFICDKQQTLPWNQKWGGLAPAVVATLSFPVPSRVQCPSCRSPAPCHDRNT